MSVYEGIVHIRHPEPLHEPTWNVLNACTFEGISFVISIRNLSKTWKKEFFGAISAGSKTLPYLSLFMKMEQLFGLFVAFCGVFLTNYFQLPS
jgi:hypothetical protein